MTTKTRIRPFRFAITDPTKEGIRDTMPADSIGALRELLGVVREFEAAANPKQAGGLYDKKGPAVEAIERAARLLWGRGVVDELNQPDENDEDDLPHMPTADDTKQGDDEDPGAATVVQDPSVATMSLERRRAEQKKVEAIADWATGRSAKPRK